MASSVYRKVLKGNHNTCRIFLQRQIKNQNVSSKVKTYLFYYQQNTLKATSEEEIPALYRKNIYKFEIPMEKASSHMSKLSVAYLAKK